MRRRTLTYLAAAALGFAYWLALGLWAGYLYRYDAPLRPPDWWVSLFPTPLGAAFTWIAIWHAATVVILSIPFAFAVSRLFPRRGVAVALAAALLLALGFETPLFLRFANFAGLLRLDVVLNFLELVVTLPTLAWGLRQFPSNYRLERP